MRPELPDHRTGKPDIAYFNKEESMQPLKGLKVVDLTTFLATPTTGRILGEWGADVVKVEAFKGDP